MGCLTWWSIPRKAWLIILGELGVIISLSVSLYMTYLNDAYFQSYANGISPVLVPALSVAFGISSASIAAYMYLGIKRIQIKRNTEVPIRRKENHSPKEVSEPRRDEISTKNDRQSQQTHGRLRPVAPSTHHVRQRSHPKDLENHDPLPETKKQP